MGTRPLAVLVCTGLAGTTLGCGSSSSYQSKERPPTPINVTAAIQDNRILVSPKSFGAGPIILIVSNQSSSAQALTFETNTLGGSAGIRQTTSPINPSGTATLKVDEVRRGSYEVRVSDRSVQPAQVRVGAPRKPATNALLQP